MCKRLECCDSVIFLITRGSLLCHMLVKLRTIVVLEWNLVDSGRSGERTLTGYPSFSVVSIMYCMLFLTSTFVVDASVLETRKRI